MMKGPPRLRRDDPGFARLVDAMRKDAPSEAQMDKALSLATKVAALPASPPAASWFGRTGSRIGLTFVGVSALIGAVAASSVRYGQAAAPSAAPSPSLTVATPRPTIVTTSAEAAVASMPVDDLPSAPVMPATPAVSGPSRAKRVEPSAVAEARQDAVLPCPPSKCGDAAGTFSEELALTSEARATLERGDVVSCLSAVDRYQRTFRGGVFSQEIEVIRIEALAKSGARERAHASSERFLDANPTSPYADRVRSVLENTKE
jgi:hypothetical protein